MTKIKKAAKKPSQRSATTKPAAKSSWGGARAGAGRKRTSTEQPHRARETFAKRTLVHVTMKVAKGVKSLRGQRIYREIQAAIAAAATRPDAIIRDYAVLDDNFHFIIDAANDSALSAATRGLAIRIARTVNPALNRVGQRLFDDRYGATILSTPAAVRQAQQMIRNSARP